MSSIYITSRLHAAWLDRARSWRREMLATISNEGSPGRRLRYAPAPSSLPPVPEEYGDVVRSLLPYINHGLNNITTSAIVAASTASLGLSEDLLLPLSYYGGQNTTRDTVIGYSREWIGIPMVAVEDFPLSSFFSDEDRPNLIAPFPPDCRGQVVFSAYHGHNLWPRRFSRVETLSEDEIEAQVHPRELERVPASTGFYVKSFSSTLRYTGCIRPPTEEELSHLFASVIHPDSWMRHHDISFREFFIHMGVPDDIWGQAMEETDRRNRADGVVPRESSVTDVPAPPRPSRGSPLDDAVITYGGVTTQGINSIHSMPPAPVSPVQESRYSTRSRIVTEPSTPNRRAAARIAAQALRVPPLTVFSEPADVIPSSDLT